MINDSNPDISNTGADANEPLQTLSSQDDLENHENTGNLFQENTENLFQEFMINQASETQSLQADLEGERLDKTQALDDLKWTEN